MSSGPSSMVSFSGQGMEMSQFGMMGQGQGQMDNMSELVAAAIIALLMDDK